MAKTKIIKKVSDRYGLTCGYVIEVEDEKEELKEFQRPLTIDEILLGTSTENIYFDSESQIILKFGKRYFITTNTGLYLLIWDICRRFFFTTPDSWVAFARDIILGKSKPSRVERVEGKIPVWLAEIALYIISTRFVWGKETSTASLF